MTNEYNKTLLEFLTNNLSPSPSGDNEFRDTNEVYNDLEAKIKAQIPNYPENWNLVNFKIRTSDTSSNFIIFGSYPSPTDPTEQTRYGVIAVINEVGELLHVYTEYESGTKLSDFLELEFDDNGNIYGIDQMTTNNYKRRVILLNNVANQTNGMWVCKLRNSYYLPDNYQSMLFQHVAGSSSIKKDPNGATYYIFGSIWLNNNYQVRLLAFTINVGSTNDWQIYAGGGTGQAPIETLDYVMNQSSGTTVINFWFKTATGQRIYTRYFDGTNLNITGDITVPGLDTGYASDIRMITSSTGYIAVAKQNTSSIYYYNGSTTTLITTKTWEDINDKGDYFLDAKDGYIFWYLEEHKEIIDGERVIDGHVITCGTYLDNKKIETETEYWETFESFITNFTVQKVFSLYKVLYQTNTRYGSANIVIYSGYSGSSYVDYNSLQPNHIEIYAPSENSQDNTIVFARPLYNLDILGATTTATTEIPNDYLNSITIYDKNLMSITNLPMVKDLNGIEKNVYEALFVNFINTISVIDEDTGTQYPNVASYVNEKITQPTSDLLSVIPITKVRINYNNSSSVIPIEWTITDDTHAETSFTVLINEAIVSVEFINEEEDTTYLTKTGIEVALGNSYRISEKIRIENV